MSRTAAPKAHSTAAEGEGTSSEPTDCEVLVVGAGPAGSACAAVAIQAPEGRMTLDELLAHVPRLREAAEAIGATFGH